MRAHPEDIGHFYGGVVSYQLPCLHLINEFVGQGLELVKLACAIEQDEYFR